MIFLDNSSSSYFKPKSVINAVKNTIEYLPFNPSRGSHSGAVKTERLILNARKNIANAFNGILERVIFTSGCTESLNLAIFGSAIEGGHVVTSVFEHNAVLRPLYRLNKAGIISLSFVSSLSAAKDAIKDNTYMLAINHVSNVTGAENDLDAYSRLAKDKDLIFLVDAAQSAGYKAIDMQKTGIDCLAIAGHKGLHGIQGAGALLLSERMKLVPFKYGGTGSNGSSPVQPDDMPDGFEAGTPATPAIAALNAGLIYSMKNIQINSELLYKMTTKIINGLEKINGVSIYSHPNNFGITAFNLTNLSSTQAGEIYNQQYDIAVRAGFHCAPLVHEHYGTKSGMIRASIGVDTTDYEIDAFLEATKEIASV
ncbi:MAG: aminotransferase class V-fold PLP-dependent enzyme [Firmicutes bacterium]|nr:aminotransferase class V-fold PLP-dependent enzyme [Bacillota bacterium]